MFNKNRNFLVFWRNRKITGIYTVQQKDYINEKETTEIIMKNNEDELPCIITNIIELNKKDYNNFIKSN